MGTDSVEELKVQAQDVLAKLGGCNDDEVAAAKRLVEELRNLRDYETMGRLAEAVSRRDPGDAKNRRLYAQCLIETGKATAAIDLLKALAQRLPKTHPEYAEATGLLGRAYKQIFFDAGDKTAEGAREALKQAIATYRRPYEENPAHTWHGVNLLALLVRARDLKLRLASDLDPKQVATKIIATLEETPKEKRDEWFLPTVAEASLGLGDWDAVERYVKAYAADKDAKAFQVASTLRQFTQVWGLETKDERGRSLVGVLRARLLSLPGGAVELGPQDLQRLQKQKPPSKVQLEAILGEDGPKTYEWWEAGLGSALSVAAVRHPMRGRIGTAFLVQAAALGLEPKDELLVLTNFHVVNEHGAYPGIRPDEATIAFEAVSPAPNYAVASILATSPPDRHDASLLRLKTPVSGIKPLPLAPALPLLDDAARVYIIGHPGGRELQFSFQDNKLLDHEGPPSGRPQIPGVVRVHYHAPTEGGSSGSPVFNADSWQVVALHHKGGKDSMPMLNGKAGTYSANEGVSIQSIAAMVKG
jgi:tetratricopeptide (TPR) repeat protein